MRLWSTDPQHANLDLLEVMMASTALPIAFKPREIQGMGKTLFIDGGTGKDYANMRFINQFCRKASTLYQLSHY
jgi:predicted acylesterase/phospholipase RssA